MRERAAASNACSSTDKDFVCFALFYISKSRIYNIFVIFHVNIQTCIQTCKTKLLDLVQEKALIFIFRSHFYLSAKPRITLPSMAPSGYSSHRFKCITCCGAIQVSNYI